MPQSISDIQFTRWLFRAYLVLLFLVPLPLGSNRPWFWSMMVAAVALLGLLWAIGLQSGKARWPGAMKRTKWPLFVLLLFCGWAGLQLLPVGWIPGFLVSPYLETGYGFTAGGARLTADIQATSDAVLLSIGLLLFAALTILLVRSKRRALMV